MSKKDVSIDSMTIKKPKLKGDCITAAAICFYPSFTNSSILRLNRFTGEGGFAVDKRIAFNYGKPDTLKFQITDIESKQALHHSAVRHLFIHSNRIHLC